MPNLRAAARMPARPQRCAGLLQRPFPPSVETSVAAPMLSIPFFDALHRMRACWLRTQPYRNEANRLLEGVR
ncbi:hypothetical protein [Burkholderia sp. Ac-20379]|uniref:hypothetical protein n=1 Tax=Burkholderia sp. Ac-20379 TaxID=2703900 RepID=UPI0019814EF4|nr:hypothetical protein [Burkholderia sp. Ac-20379]